MNKKIAVAFYFFLSLSLVFCNTLSAQSDYSITNFTSKNGLLQNSVEAMIMDKDHFLWIASENGLIRFDGIHFRAYLNEGTPVNLFGMAKTLNEEILCFDSQSGCYLIRDSKVSTLRKMNQNGINYMLINGVLPNKEFYLQNTERKENDTYRKNWLRSPITLFTISESEFLIRTLNGIALYKNGKLFKEKDLTSYQANHFLEIEGNIYFFDAINQLYRIDKKTLTTQKCHLSGALLQNNFLSKTQIDNEFWNYNSSDACLQFAYSLYSLSVGTNPNTINSELITDKLPHNCLIVSAVYRKTEQLLAIGTDTKGLFLFKKKNFKTLVYETPESNTNNAYYCQVELDSNRIYTDWSREFSINGAVKSNLPIVRDYNDPLFRDEKGIFWYMNLNSFMKFDPSELKPKEIKIIGNERVYAFYQDSDSILIGMSFGLGYLKKDSVRKFLSFTNNGASSNIFRLFRWKDNRIWFANYAGIFQYNSTTGKIDTLQALYHKDPYNITLCDDYILIGTYGNGFYFYKDGKTVKMPLNISKSLRYVNTLVRDNLEYLWISTNQGLVKTRFEDLTNYFKDTTSSVFYIQYGEEDGIINTEFNGGNAPTNIVLKNGYISLPTMDGLVWFNPHSVFDPSLDATLRIDEVYLNDSLISLDKPKLVVPAGDQRLRFNYTTPFWGNQENLCMEYQLEGYSKEWLPVNLNQNFIEFSNLSSGNYTLKLRKNAGFGNENYVTTDLSIIVQKQFYEKTGFILFCIFATFLLVFGVARVYAFNIKQKNFKLEKNVQQRTLELSHANDELKQSVDSKDKLISIISHDIITPLRFITMVAQKGSEKFSELDKQKIKLALSDIRNTSQKLHDNAQNVLNWIKHQNKRIAVNKSNVAIAALVDTMVQQYSDMAASRETKIISIVSEEDVIKTDPTILSIILNNIISNACKFTNNGLIELRTEQTSDFYRIVIKDSGNGMRPEHLKRIKNILQKKETSALNKAFDESGNGLGYIIITELIELIGGYIEIESTLGKGTCVTINLQLLQK